MRVMKELETYLALCMPDYAEQDSCGFPILPTILNQVEVNTDKCQERSRTNFQLLRSGKLLCSSSRACCYASCRYATRFLTGVEQQSLTSVEHTCMLQFYWVSLGLNIFSGGRHATEVIADSKISAENFQV